MNDEIWVVIPDWDAYEVSSLGRVRRIETGHILSQNKDKDGYLRLNLSIKGRRKNFRVHMLVMRVFVGPMPPDKDQVAHWDGDKENNCPVNLRYAVGTENCEDRTRHGRMPLGERHFNAKITDEQAISIFEERKTSRLTIAELSKKYGTTRGSIENIIYAEGRFKFLANHPFTNIQRISKAEQTS